MGWRDRSQAASGPPAYAATPHFTNELYLLEYVLVDDYLAREVNRRGDLVLEGALAEPPGRAVLIWRTDDRFVVERFAEGDLYVRKGLVTSWTIRTWTVVIGDEPGTAHGSHG